MPTEVGSISIKVTPDTKRFRAELAAQLAAIEKSLEADIPARLELDTNNIGSKVKAATAGLDQTVNVKLDVDRSALDRLRTALTRGTGGNGFGGGSGIPLGSFADSAALVAAVAAIAAPALALLTGALATLPAVIAGVLTPIAAIALGMDGLKKSAEVLAQPLLDLKTVMSQKFEDVFTPILVKATALFPALARSLPAVADGLGRMADSFVSTITSSGGLEKIERTIKNIADGIATAAPGVGSLTNGLLGLATGVSAKFPAVSQWFNNASDAFSRWVDKVTADGSLDRAMGNLGDVAKGLFDIVGDLAKQGFDFLQDPEFGQSMKDFVSSAQSLINDILPGLKDFFMDLEGAISGVVSVIDWLKNNKPPEWALPDSSDNPEGTVPGKGDGILPQLLPKEDLLENLRNILSTANLPLLLANQFQPGNALDGVWQGIEARGRAAFANIASSIVPTLATAFVNIQSIAAGAWNGLVGIAANVVTQVISQFARVPQGLAAAWSGIVSTAASIWNAVVSAVANAISQVVSAVVQGGAQVVGEVSSWPGKIAAALAGLAATGAEAGRALVQGLIGGIGDMIGAAVAKAQELASAVAAAAKSALGINSPSKVFTEIGAQTAQGLQNGLEGGFQGVIERARLLAEELAATVNGGLEGVDGEVLDDRIKRQLDELEIQRGELKVQKNAIPKEDKDARAAVQSQLDQITALKDQLRLEKDRLGFSQQYSESLDENNAGAQALQSSLSGMVDTAKGFATANANQFMSDLGIGGNGALSQLANHALDWGTQLLGSALGGGGTTIQVNSVDEAISFQQRQTAKKAMQYVRR